MKIETTKRDGCVRTVVYRDDGTIEAVTEFYLAIPAPIYAAGTDWEDLCDIRKRIPFIKLLRARYEVGLVAAKEMEEKLARFAGNDEE